MKIQWTSDNPICNIVGERAKIEFGNPYPYINSTESFIGYGVMRKNKKGSFVLNNNVLNTQRKILMDMAQVRKHKNLTAATELHELRNTTSDSETFLGRFKQQNNEISQQFNFNGGAHLIRCRQFNCPRHQEVSRYRIQER